MERNSSNTNQEDKTSNMQKDLERLKEIDPALFDSLQEELTRATSFLDKAIDQMKGLCLQEKLEMTSLARPPEEVHEVLCALMYLLAGNTPDSFIKVDKKKSPLDLTWKGCLKMFGDSYALLNYGLKVGEWINEGKITYEMTVPVRGYLEKPWFNKESLKRVSKGAVRIGEFVRNMIEYFDAFEEVRAKVRTRLEGSGKA